MLAIKFTSEPAKAFVNCTCLYNFTPDKLNFFSYPSMTNHLAIKVCNANRPQTQICQNRIIQLFWKLKKIQALNLKMLSIRLWFINSSNCGNFEPDPNTFFGDSFHIYSDNRGYMMPVKSKDVQ